MLKRTPLFQTHLEAHAKLVDFGGWEMPLHYGSQIDEHHAVRRDAGMFDVSHMLAVDLNGDGVPAFLRVLLANNIDKLNEDGRALYSAMLNEAGGVIDDLIVYRVGVTSDTGTHPAYRVVLNAGTADTDLLHINAVKAAPVLGFEPFTITPRRDLAIIAVQGPNARAKVWQAFPAWRAATENLGVFQSAVCEDGAFVARTGYTGEDGFEIMCNASDAASLWGKLRAVGVAPCGLGARDTLRLEAGMNLYGNDMDTTISPLDAGLGWTVDRKIARPFIGRQMLETQGQTRTFVGLKLLDRGVLRAHMRVVTALGEGEITSGTFSPTLGFSIAMARVPKGVAVGDKVEIELRGKLMAAEVVKMPFVRNGKALIS